MYCSNCGSETTAAFCSVCGTPATRAATTTRASAIYAGWWARVGATIIDNLILVIPSAFVAYVVGRVTNYLAADVAAILVESCYLYVMLTRSEGQTIGNRVVGTRVRSALDGGPVSPDQILKRIGRVAVYSCFVLVGSGGLQIVGLIGLLDDLFPLFSPTKQTLHDKFAGSVVVKV